MIDVIKGLFAYIWCVIKSLFGFGQKPDPDPDPKPEPKPLPAFVEEMRKQHPDKSDDELREAYWATAQVPTVYLQTKGQRNDLGKLILTPFPDYQLAEVSKGEAVYVYRWAFQADGQTVRETVYDVTPGYKGLVNIKLFSKP